MYTLLIDPGSTITGRFSSLNVDGYASSDKDWQIVYTPHTVYAVLPPAPEPAAFAPFAAGLLGVGLFRRRRKV